MDQALLDGGYRCYTGEKIDVYFNTAICQHSGNWPDVSYTIRAPSRHLS